MAKQVNTKAESFQGKTVTLKSDLDLSGHLWVPIGQNENGFLGTFDGGSRNISGLNIQVKGDYAGLFGYVGDLEGHGGIVKNVRLRAPKVSGQNYVGAVVGYCDNGELTNCRVDDGSITGHNLVGGLVGDLDHGKLSRCFSSNSTVTGYDFVGGIAGDNSGTIEITWGGQSMETYNGTGLVTASAPYAWVGGIAGHNAYGGQIVNCYKKHDLSLSQNVAGHVSEAEFSRRGLGQERQNS